MMLGSFKKLPKVNLCYANFYMVPCAWTEFYKYRRWSSDTSFFSSTFYQHDYRVSELPIVFKYVNGKEALHAVDKSFKEVEVRKSSHTWPILMNHLNKVHSRKLNTSIEEAHLYNILVSVCLISRSNLTTKVALRTLYKIIEIENLKLLSVGLDEIYTYETLTMRNSVVTLLIEVIAESNSCGTAESILKVLKVNNVNEKINFITYYCEEVICRINGGNLNIYEICSFVKFLISLDLEVLVDKTWFGLLGKECDIDSVNKFLAVIRILSYFDLSKYVILEMLERVCYKLWWKFSITELLEIVNNLNKNNLNSVKVFSILVKWLSLNHSTVTPTDFISLITLLLSNDYRDVHLISVFTQYLNLNGIDITTIISILKYCVNYRLRCAELMEVVAETIISQQDILSPSQFKDLFLPLGILYYIPMDTYKFWQAIEKLIKKNFVLMHPEDVIDILLNCIYLNKCPTNFQHKIFNPYFIDRCFKSNNKNNEIGKSLKLIDFAMSLEQRNSKEYLASKKTEMKGLWLDERIKRSVNNLRPVLSALVSESNRISYFIIPPKFPSLNLYIIDALIHPSHYSLKNILRKFHSGMEEYLAVLILLPEYYCNNSSQLIGPQEMRLRHFQKVGFKVAVLNYEKLAEYFVQPLKYKEYVKSCLEIAQR